jgi:hypothetical protein
MVEHDTYPLTIVPHSTLAGRLVRSIRWAAGELSDSPTTYLRVAFGFDRVDTSLILRLVSKLGATLREVVTHPLRYLRGSVGGRAISTVLALNSSTLSAASFVDGRFIGSAVSDEPLIKVPRRRLRPWLAGSGFVHSFLIVYLIYIAIVSPWAGIRVVSKPYRQFDPTMLGPLKYPPELIRREAIREALRLEEIQERERKRREKLARDRERLEREKAEREQAEKERQLAEAKAAEEKKAQEQAKAAGKAFEFNEAALKDVVSKIYALYQAGGLEVDLNHFSVMLGFQIEPDGSLSKIRVIRSSGSKGVDQKAADVLWTIGESHALGPLSNLTSNSIRLDIDENIAKLSITGFAPSPDEAKKKAGELGFLFTLLRASQKSKNPEVAELLALAKIKSVNNRIDADLTVSRARAAEMMRARFGGNSTPQ